MTYHTIGAFSSLNINAATATARIIGTRIHDDVVGCRASWITEKKKIADSWLITTI